MKIIISPAKKMKTNPDLAEFHDLPAFFEDAGSILEW